MLKQDSSKYRGYRNAGIRLSEEMLPHLGTLYKGRTQIMLPAVHAFDEAHTVMLVEQGELPREMGAAILKGLRDMAQTEGVVQARLRVGGGMHSGEHYLIRLLGEDVGGRFHVARSSGDLGSVAINILQREKLLATMAAMNRLRGTLIRLAREHTDTIMPGYSFGQHAQPMTLGHLYLSWAATLERDFDRHLGAYRRVNTSPAGAAIMVGSDFRIDRRRTADLLGFDAVHENCADAILELNADDNIETAMVVATLYHSMAKWADDIILWSTSEFDFIDVPDRYCGTSSIMMQKKNVIGPAEVKGASAEALGCVVTSYHALKGTTGSPITERYYALDMHWRVTDNSVRHLDWFTELLPEIRVNKAHMREQSWLHWATTTDIASALIRKHDWSWRTAHQVVGILVRLCESRGVGPAQVTPEMLDEASMAYHEIPAGLTREEIAAALDPGHFIASRTLQGGPAPAESLRQADHFERLLVRDQGELEAVEMRLAEAAGRLRAAADAIIDSAAS